MNKSKPNVLIIGGGVAGLAAAQALDAYGVSVDVVEKRARLGGNAGRWACMATDSCRYCGACLSDELAEQVLNTSHATVHLNSKVDRLGKQGERFKALLKGGGQPDPIYADAVLLATGMIPFDPSGNSDLGYDEFEQVITSAELNEAFQEDRLGDLLPATPEPSIAFIQCVGSRDRQSGRDYCSQVCCKTTVRHVNKMLHQIPRADITVFHIDLQIIGKAFRHQASAIQSRVTLQQGVPAKIWNNRQPGKVSVIQEDAPTGARTARHFDLIVLAVGIRPAAQSERTCEQLCIGMDDWGFVRGGCSPAPGIYAAGAVLEPVDILSARQQGIRAAYRMAEDFGWVPKLENPPGIAVIGGTREAAIVARDLSDSGYRVSLLDTGVDVLSSGDHPADEAFDYHAGTQLISMNGTSGAFRMSFASGGEIRRLNAGAVIVAAGTKQQPILQHHDRILSLSQFVAAQEYGDLKNADTVVFWLDHHGPEWKAFSRQCLQQAVNLVSEGKRVVVIMEKMLVHGLKGQRIYNQARHMGVRFLRVSHPDQVALATGDGGISLEVNEATLSGVRVVLNTDLLVIPEAVQPASSSDLISRFLRQHLDEEGFLQSANVRHRPVGSPRQGIFFIGSCHDETDGTDLQREIDTVKVFLHRMTSGRISLEPPAIIDKGKCGRCLTCYRACPHAAVILHNDIQPMIVSEVCVGCGICISSCPAKAISAAPRAQLPDVGPAEGATVIFACERSGALAARKAGLDSENIKLIKVRCAGQLDEQTLLQPLIEGAAEVIVAACHEGNCRSMTGSRVAAVRISKMMDQLSLDYIAVRHHHIAANEPARMIRIATANGFAKENAAYA